jgi:hypothetical protein
MTWSFRAIAFQIILLFVSVELVRGQGGSKAPVAGAVAAAPQESGSAVTKRPSRL